MNTLRERLTRVLRGRVTALRGLTGTTFLGASVMALAAISVAVLVLLGTGTQDSPPAKGAVPISMTRLVADAKAGRLANAVVDEANLVVQATYGPGTPVSAARAAESATDGGTLSGHAHRRRRAGPPRHSQRRGAGRPGPDGIGCRGECGRHRQECGPHQFHRKRHRCFFSCLRRRAVSLGYRHRTAGPAGRIARDRPRVALAQGPRTGRRAR